MFRSVQIDGIFVLLFKSTLFKSNVVAYPDYYICVRLIFQVLTIKTYDPLYPKKLRGRSH